MAHPGATTRALFPSFASGEKRFFDPFPSLLIQDEAHLLDESLGTFSGLFESALEAAFDQLALLLKGHLSYEPESSQSVEKSRSLPRRPRSASRSARCATSTSATTRSSSRTRARASTTRSTRRPTSPTPRRGRRTRGPVPQTTWSCAATGPASTPRS